MSRRIENPAVAAVFDAYPVKFRRKLLALRKLVLEVAAATDGVGEIEETLKWGEPAFVTSQTKSGTTIRIDWKEASPTQYAMYFHCQTDLIERFREMFSDVLDFEGNRAIVFEGGDALPVEPLRFCIEAALTYHLDKKRAKRRSRGG